MIRENGQLGIDPPKPLSRIPAKNMGMTDNGSNFLAHATALRHDRLPLS
jgi:hypothetical protein